MNADLTDFLLTSSEVYLTPTRNRYVPQRKKSSKPEALAEDLKLLNPVAGDLKLLNPVKGDLKSLNSVAGDLNANNRIFRRRKSQVNSNVFTDWVASFFC